MCQMSFSTQEGEASATLALALATLSAEPKAALGPRLKHTKVCSTEHITPCHDGYTVRFDTFWCYQYFQWLDLR